MWALRAQRVKDISEIKKKMKKTERERVLRVGDGAHELRGESSDDPCVTTGSADRYNEFT